MALALCARAGFESLQRTIYLQIPKFGYAAHNIPFCIKTEYCHSMGYVSTEIIVWLCAITFVIAFLFWRSRGNEKPLKESCPRSARRGIECCTKIQASSPFDTHTVPLAREVLCSCLHGARVQRANKTSIFRFGEMGARCLSFVFILWPAPKNEPRKRAKGPNARWKPAVRKGRGAVALLIFSQK